MSNYSYIAIDSTGAETRGTLEVADPTAALRRIKEMGLFPTKVVSIDGGAKTAPPRRVAIAMLTRPRWLRFGPRVPSRRLSVFTRQLATLTEAGMPLLRGLRILEQQEESRAFKRVIGEISAAIEDGCSLAEAVSAHRRVFNHLYVSMVRAGEISGALEVTLNRLAEFMEKSQRIKGRIKAALFYPCAVLVVAAVIVGVLMAYVIPRFQGIFTDFMGGRPLPPFTRFVFGLSGAIVHHLWLLPGALALIVISSTLFLKTAFGRFCFDRFKLAMPILGSLFRKAAISRLTRTLGTLVSNGVPILQALTIVKETAGNVAVGNIVARVHENVKQGDPIAPTLKSSTLFPAMVAGMVDVGEQTGALPEMLLKVADTYDEEVNNASNALSSLLEPVTIVFLAVIVGSIVIAMFLPLITLVTIDPPSPENRAE